MVTQAKPAPVSYADEQYQNPEPIGPQAPMLTGVRDIEMSWDRNAGYMRTIIEDQRWWFKEVVGKAVILDTDSSRGRMNIRAKAQLLDERLVLWRPSTAEPHPSVEGERYTASHQQVCYYRARQVFRITDTRERAKGSTSALTLVKGYVGDWVVEWPLNDIIAHLFHDGPWILCDPGCFMHKGGGYAHFYEE
jgi:hypothetical protein